jgi:hypothetical protein
MLVAAQAPTPFGAIATHSGMPSVHLQSINAANGSFWIGMPTSSFCPTNIPPEDCPPGTTTAFVGGNPTLNLDVVVPGGQEGKPQLAPHDGTHSWLVPPVFVQSSGQLGFTQAHAPVIPDGATLTGFSWTQFDNDGGLGELSFSGFGATTFTACPRGDPAPYLIFARVPLQNFESCTDIGIVTGPFSSDEAAAWQYV